MNYKKETMLIAFETLICVLIVAAVFFLVSEGYDRNAKHSCRELQHQSETINWATDSDDSGWYLTKWQKEECDLYGIHVDGPVL